MSAPRLRPNNTLVVKRHNVVNLQGASGRRALKVRHAASRRAHFLGFPSTQEAC